LVGEDLLIAEEDTTAATGQQLGRSRTGGHGAESWENDNDEARWHATLDGSNVGVGEDLLFSEGAEVVGCAQIRRRSTGGQQLMSRRRKRIRVVTRKFWRVAIGKQDDADGK
jgi:hypothetical protein